MCGHAHDWLWTPMSGHPGGTIMPPVVEVRRPDEVCRPGTDLPAHLSGALTGLADALAEQTGGGATVTALNTPLVRAWRAHPAG
jgi:hypothetical protein